MSCKEQWKSLWNFNWLELIRFSIVHPLFSKLLGKPRCCDCIWLIYLPMEITKRFFKMCTKNYFLEFNKTLIFKEPMNIMKNNWLESLSLLIPLHLLFFPFIFYFEQLPLKSHEFWPARLTQKSTVGPSWPRVWPTDQLREE